MYNAINIIYNYINLTKQITFFSKRVFFDRENTHLFLPRWQKQQGLYDSKYPRHVIRPKDHEIEPRYLPPVQPTDPQPLLVPPSTWRHDRLSTLPPSSPAMEQAACRTPIVRKGMAQVGQKKRERERERGWRYRTARYEFIFV